MEIPMAFLESVFSSFPPLLECFQLRFVSSSPSPCVFQDDFNVLIVQLWEHALEILRMKEGRAGTDSLISSRTATFQRHTQIQTTCAVVSSALPDTT